MRNLSVSAEPAVNIGRASQQALPRTHVTAPLSQPEAARLIIVPSGRVARFDQPGFELQLYEQLAGRLVGHGIATLRFDIEDRRPRAAVSTTQRQAARTERLSRVLAEELSGPSASPLVLLGVSLGAQSVIDLLARVDAARIRGAILVGCIVEAPMIVLPRLEWLTFIFGARDLVAYADECGTLGETIPPTRYGPETAANIVVLPRTRVEVEILAGLGHRLERAGADAPDDATVALLAERLVRVATQPAGPS